MNQSEFKKAANRAVKVSELIEEIIRIDDLLALHEQFQAQNYEKQQYIDRRRAFMAELNQLLTPHHLKLVSEGQAA